MNNDFEFGINETPEDLARRKRLLAQALAAQGKPMLASTSGTTSMPEAPFTDADKKAPEIPDNESLWKQRRDALDAEDRRLQELASRPLDAAGYEAAHKQRGDIAGSNLMLSLLAQNTTGHEALGKQLMANALAAQGDFEVGGGVVGANGKWSEAPAGARRRELTAAEMGLNRGERRLTADQAAADRAEGRRIQGEDRLSAAEYRKAQMAHLAAQTAALRAKPDPMMVVPEGAQLLNRSTGQFVQAPGGTGASQRGWTTGDKNTFNESSDALSRATTLQKRMEGRTPAEREGMGGLRNTIDTGLGNMTRGAIGLPNAILPGSEKTRAATTAIAREGATIAHELDGAAVTQSEGFDKNRFIPQVGDSYATVKMKIDEAAAYAAQKRQDVAARHGGAASPFAPPKQTSGSPLMEPLPAGFTFKVR